LWLSCTTYRNERLDVAVWGQTTSNLHESLTHAAPPPFSEDTFVNPSAGKTMVINYGVTQQGLTEQLLNVTVKHERPDLEEARETLVKVGEEKGEGRVGLTRGMLRQVQFLRRAAEGCHSLACAGSHTSGRQQSCALGS
jgi:hypothetical protein